MQAHTCHCCLPILCPLPQSSSRSCAVGAIETLLLGSPSRPAVRRRERVGALQAKHLFSDTLIRTGSNMGVVGASPPTPQWKGRKQAPSLGREESSPEDSTNLGPSLLAMLTRPASTLQITIGKASSSFPWWQQHTGRSLWTQPATASFATCLLTSQQRHTLYMAWLWAMTNNLPPAIRLASGTASAQPLELEA